jgi:hypothetical protein
MKYKNKMTNCNQTKIKENRWNYCTMAPDKLFGVQLNCCCKQHDIDYATNGKITSRKEADKRIRNCIITQFIKAKKIKLGYVIGYVYWLFCRIFGYFYWKKWSLEGVQKYL